jgi:hypothetical protein
MPVLGTRRAVLSANTSIYARAKTIMQRRGDSLLLPGIGRMNGFNPEFFTDSSGITHAVLDDFIGFSNDCGFGGLVFTQATIQNKPRITKSTNLLVGLSTGIGWLYDYKNGTEFRITRSSTSESGYIYSKEFKIFNKYPVTLSFESMQIGSVNSCELYILGHEYWVTGAIKNIIYENSTTWIKNTFTFQLDESVEFGDSVIRFDHNGGDGSASSVCVRNLKLEYGNTATQWNFSFEDDPDYDTAGFPYRLQFDETDTLSAVIPAGYEAATVIYAVPGGQVTMTNQNLSAAGVLTLGPNLILFALIVCKTHPDAADLAALQALANKLAGV